MRFSSAAMALRGESLKLEGTTGVEEAEMFDVWAMTAVRYGLRVVGQRVEFYKRSAKNQMHARLVLLEGQNDTPATDDLDDVMEKLDMHMATQLIKAAASLHATNAVKRIGDSGAASQYSWHRRPPRWLATQQRVESWRLLGASEFLCRSVQFGNLEQLSNLFSSGEVMNPIRQTPEDLAFGREDLRAGCLEGIYEEVTT
jgi:hypothetical protein